MVSIQQLRGIAAMLVVLHHSCGATGWLANPLASSRFGEAGVDIFFVISGFIMYVAARREGPREFWIKRLIRILPLYWIATATLLVFQFHKIGSGLFQYGMILRSIFLIPYHPVPGDWRVYPVLVPGWSLEIELFFYLLFGIGLMIGRPALFSALLILAGVAAGFLLAPTGAAAFMVTRPILMEFVVGLGLAALFERGQISPRLAPVALTGAAIILLSDALPYSPALRGIGAVAVVLGALAMESGGRIVRAPFATQLGDASYSIYLFHTPVLLVMFKLFPHVPLHGPVQFAVFLLTCLSSSAVAGVLISRHVEQPVIAWARRHTLRRAASPLWVSST